MKSRSTSIERLPHFGKAGRTTVPDIAVYNQAEEPARRHIYYDKYNSLQEESDELMIRKHDLRQDQSGRFTMDTYQQIILFHSEEI